jgi:hypothetical protein
LKKKAYRRIKKLR